ncbi:hypothetical protein [Cohnella rhizosphaerae]|uniref:Uncharacterized protein n=1 Tax=Cohnella rhizosphaerae TaxID=1457232 RepID=A0A9X4KWF8_9BACL|nr:hypothetical protein [Cohnella rhizosphaerae]MDG0812135.1 hypothetical protein [Cohnella rhizosphaerae]
MRRISGSCSTRRCGRRRRSCSWAVPTTGEAGLWHSEAAAAVERLLPRVQSQILLSSNRHRTMARKLSRIVSQTSAMLGGARRAVRFSSGRP